MQTLKIDSYQGSAKKNVMDDLLRILADMSAKVSSVFFVFPLFKHRRTEKTFECIFFISYIIKTQNNILYSVFFLDILNCGTQRRVTPSAGSPTRKWHFVVNLILTTTNRIWLWPVPAPTRSSAGTYGPARLFRDNFFSTYLYSSRFNEFNVCSLHWKLWLFKDYTKKPGEISQIKIFNPNLRKNKSYAINLIHKNMKYMPLQLN